MDLRNVIGVDTRRRPKPDRLADHLQRGLINSASSYCNINDTYSSSRNSRLTCLSRCRARTQCCLTVISLCFIHLHPIVRSKRSLTEAASHLPKLSQVRVQRARIGSLSCLPVQKGSSIGVPTRHLRLISNNQVVSLQPRRRKTSPTIRTHPSKPHFFTSSFAAIQSFSAP